MSDEIVKVACPSCNATYELPAEYRGQSGECTQCGAVFEIPLTDEVTGEGAGNATEAGVFSGTDTDSMSQEATASVESDAPAEEAKTNTVKLSRMKVGMVPKVSDNFTLDVVNKPAVASKTGIQIKKSPSASNSNMKKTEPSAPPPAAKPWWKFW